MSDNFLVTRIPNNTASPKVTTLAWRDSQGNEVLAFNACQASKDFSTLPGEELDSQSLGQFSQLISQLPGLATMAELQSGSYLECNLAAEVLTRAKDGNGFRAFVQGPDGRIVENARFFEADKLNALVNSGVLFNVLSTVVAQKHLADINKKLGEIQKGVEFIKSFLNEERKSKIHGMLEYIRPLIVTIQQGNNLPEREKISLAGKYPDFLGVLKHLECDIDQALKELEKVNHSSKFDSADTRKDIRKIINNLEGLLSCYQQSSNILLLIDGILHHQEPDESIYLERSKNRMKQAKEYLSSYKSKVDYILSSKILKISPIFELASTTLANKIQIKNTQENFLISCSGSINDFQKKHESLFPQGEKKISLLIKNGQVARGKFLS